MDDIGFENYPVEIRKKGKRLFFSSITKSTKK